MDYIVVQAGGKGTRLEHLTANKPKALVPVENLPMLFHLFRKFPEKRFIIIADYKKDVLREYLACFADVKYQVVDAEGTGTCAGVSSALEFIPEGEQFMLVWSDLILPDGFRLPADVENYIGISETFPCRWSYKNGLFEERSSHEDGVAGLFVFKEKACVRGLPKSGEFVRWLCERDFGFRRLSLAGTKEFGLLSEYEKLTGEKCRPFNKMTISGEVVTKEPLDEQGRALAAREERWYKAAQERGVSRIPKILDTAPLKMERIDGKNIYEYGELDHSEKLSILKKLVTMLQELHSTQSAPVDSFSVKDAYYGKTIARLRQIRDLLPFADRKTITINGLECRNIYYYKRDFERLLESLNCGRFAFIHGDCTFSNLMLRGGTEPVMIDPRGYFGHTELFGDPNYDWAKLYYSLVGNYDRFNLKDFRLVIGEKDVTLKIASNGWEDLEGDFFSLSGADERTIQLLHAVIWLSLTTYAWQDYDSICGAFYNGLYYLEKEWLS